MKTLIVITLIGHILGDYYFQSDGLCENKKKHYHSVIKHNVFYFLTMLATSLVFLNVKAVILFTILGVLHALIDTAKFVFNKFFIKQKQRYAPWVYSLDQCLHIGSIIGVIYWYLPSSSSNMGESTFHLICLHILGVLLILKPTNVTFKILYAPIKETIISNNHLFSKDFNTGKLIGNLERLLIYSMLVLNQYSAIGFIFAAKSITRFKKLDDKTFAEYYLLGTLFSILSTVLIYHLLFFSLN